MTQKSNHLQNLFKSCQQKEILKPSNSLYCTLLISQSLKSFLQGFVKHVITIKERRKQYFQEKFSSILQKLKPNHVYTKRSEMIAFFKKTPPLETTESWYQNPPRIPSNISSPPRILFCEKENTLRLNYLIIWINNDTLLAMSQISA